MGLWSDHLLPRAIDWALGRPEALAERRLVTPGLRGRVLEIGFGSGLNLPFYPAEVTHVWALDPSSTALRLARGRIERFPGTLEALPFEAGRIPLPDGCADAVLSTWTLCTIPALPQALAEVSRVLRPEGRFHFLEHGLSEEPRVARWQRRLTPLQRRVAGGCRLDLDVRAAVTSAGFTLASFEHTRMRGPRIATELYRGVARPPTCPTP